MQRDGDLTMTSRVLRDTAICISFRLLTLLAGAFCTQLSCIFDKRG